MNNKFKLIILIVLFILFIGVNIVLFLFKIFDYLIISGLVSIMIFISIILNIKRLTSDDNKKYLYSLNRILKIYNPILVETKNFPNIHNKSILKVNTMEDLINAQCEIKKPIYYIKSSDSTVFYLLDNDLMLIYFIKVDVKVASSLEVKLNDLDSLSKGYVMDSDII